jgi:hypothetical protein
MHDTRCSGFVGGDPGAITVPNFFQHFSPGVVGASVGSHFLEWAGWVSSPVVVFAPSLCLGAVLLTLGAVYWWRVLSQDHKPEQDRLNAAQSNAGAIDLQSQLECVVRPRDTTLSCSVSIARTC